MKERVVLVVHALVGWAVCGMTVALGREVLSMQSTLILHAVVAPLAFWVLAWRYALWFPKGSPVEVSATMLGVVVGLDAFVVAPLLERSYAMFRSVLGTWIPFALILASSYLGFRWGVSRLRPSTEPADQQRGGA